MRKEGPASNVNLPAEEARVKECAAGEGGRALVGGLRRIKEGQVGDGVHDGN